eukprot:TRINITY_DN8657_c1_g1_i2.p1 TRINITY_DN8657_c1_g1~~TRINITY_DN8657_c1_g1_i2.p1  ORF type:complete len:609 (+),score=56.87 TRINITY_DN8657_c1_g1_i2:191-1828(+)
MISVLCITFLLGFISAQERTTVEGFRCELPFLYDNQIRNDCIEIDGEQRCLVGSEFKVCQPQESEPSPQSQSDCQRPTKAGCLCLEQWSHNGRIQNGCSIPDADPNGPWCLIQPDSCEEGEPFGVSSSPQFDYCVPECGPESAIPTQIADRDLDDCSVTQGYCICQEEWSYRGQVYQGCANPDDDVIGSWCIVEDETSCSPRGNLRSDQIASVMQFLLGVPAMTGSPVWDYCQPSCGKDPSAAQSISNFDSLNSTSLAAMGLSQKEGLADGVLANLPELPQENDDQDKIEYSQDYQQNVNQNESYTADQYADQDIDYYSQQDDYSVFSLSSSPENTYDVANFDQGDIPLSPSPTPTSTPELSPPSSPFTTDDFKSNSTSNNNQNMDPMQVARSIAIDIEEEPQNSRDCLTTKNGCKCRPGGWNWDSNQDGLESLYMGCAKTLNYDSPWCLIEDSSKCTNPPYQPEWDFCEDACIQPTQGTCKVTENGCDCLEQWSYEGINQMGCTRPDAEKQFSWCVVDPDTCSKGGPEGVLNTAELFDRCPEGC